MKQYKLTVIIPTMYKVPAKLEININRLLKQECKIILIDNSPRNSCRKWEGNEKIKIRYFPSNIGISLAWNIGVELADTEYYCLLNDDCLIWNNFVSKTVYILDNHKDVGILSYKTLTTITDTIYDSLFVNLDKESNLIDMTASSNPKLLGWLICGRKEEYTEIPTQLKIFYGDDFIYQVTRRNGKRTVYDSSHIISHEVSATINSVFGARQSNHLLEVEGQEYQKIIASYKLQGF
jgi:glycosyltransferase involved in cell wall biosynthesis